jgi:4-aminobutyrate aminotransferase-like enzyme
MTDLAATTLMARRRAVLGPAYRHFYDEPLQPVRGEGVWLYDAEGRAYLDCYNNVPSVGHCHPAIVAALAGQAATLNTHTRYPQEGIVAYAERLVAKFPAALDTAMFTCTGSEANDLALRVAFEVTGGRGLIVTENAYHGVTMALADISPSLQPTGPHVRLIRAPDAYRAVEGTDLAARFAADIRDAAESLRAAGHAPAALIVDTTFASDGIFMMPGVLSAGAEAIRAAGGLFIADEVQGGFGRSGAWWGFERDAGLVPDIVTLGKPMGAGHPMGGMIIKAELIAAFGQKRRYFNTFGGNTVSAAVGMAVLEVIEGEGLLESAAKVGAQFREELCRLAMVHERIGDVRGSGLYLGVELVADRKGKAPWTEGAARLVNELRRNDVLIGTCGKAANVLKIRPPLAFKAEHVGRFIEALDRVLKAG